MSSIQCNRVAMLTITFTSAISQYFTFPSATALRCSPYGLLSYAFALSISVSLSMKPLMKAISSGVEMVMPCLDWFISTKVVICTALVTDALFTCFSASVGCSRCYLSSFIGLSNIKWHPKSWFTAFNIPWSSTPIVLSCMI